MEEVAHTAGGAKAISSGLHSIGADEAAHEDEVQYTEELDLLGELCDKLLCKMIDEL